MYDDDGDMAVYLEEAGRAGESRERTLRVNIALMKERAARGK